MKKGTVWTDISGKDYRLDEIDNRYLKNILLFLYRGNFSISRGEDDIKTLYFEAKKRNIGINFSLDKLLSIYRSAVNDWAGTPDWWDFGW